MTAPSMPALVEEGSPGATARAWLVVRTRKKRRRLYGEGVKVSWLASAQSSRLFSKSVFTPAIRSNWLVG